MLELHVHLEKRHPARNQCRFYALHAMPTLFGGWTLVREWGWVGRPGRVVVEGFETLAATPGSARHKSATEAKARLWPTGPQPHPTATSRAPETTLSLCASVPRAAAAF